VDLGLGNKVALIAGGSSGLGFAVARELAAEGAHVAIGARDRTRLARAERGLAEVARGRVCATSVDICDAESVRRWVDTTAAEHGALHIVLVSGGSPPAGYASQFAPGDYQSAVGAVVLPAVNVALAALPHLRAARWGRLLFVTSETASVPIPSLALSGLARAGIARFAQALAAEAGRDGVTVNVLSPSATRTEMTQRAAARLAALYPDLGDAETHLAAMGRHNAVGRIARADEFAALATFLASERASFITGGVHLIDGGASVMGPELPHFTNAPRDTYS
jgi:3-oxoacyl-[acyl-carrier protein] reductase